MRLVLPSRLGSAASDLFTEARAETPLKLVRESLTEPARQYTFRDAAAGVVPASEADDESRWTPRGTIAPDFPEPEGPSLLDRLRSIGLSSEEVEQRVESAVERLAPEPVLRVTSVVGVVTGVTAIAFGFPKVGFGIGLMVLLDMALRQTVSAYRERRQWDPRLW